MSNLSNRLYAWALNEEMIDTHLTEHGCDCISASELLVQQDAEIERLRVVVARRADEAQRDYDLIVAKDLRTRQLLAWIENVATDEQLDMPVPALCGITGRSFFAEGTR